MLPTFVNGEDYTEHNSNIADGVSGVMNASEELSKMGYDKIHFVYGKGNFILVVAEGHLTISILHIMIYLESNNH